MEIVLILVGRTVFGGFFIMSGVGHFTGLEQMTPYTASKGLPAARMLVLLSGMILVAGGLSMILGVLPTLGAWALALFLVIAAVSMHDFWTEDDAMGRQTQMVHFMKDLALAGAALMISAMGPWPLSLWAASWPLAPGR